MVRLKPERPRLIWKDGSFQENTLTALNYMRKNKHFCDVTLQVKEINIRTILRTTNSLTLESLIIVPLVIKVLQSNGGVKIVLYDFLTAMSL